MRIAAFSSYRSQNPQGQYINYIQELQYSSYKARIQYFSRSRLSRRGLIRQWFILPQLYYIIDRQRTPSKGPSPLLYSSLFLFLLSLGYLGFLSLISTPQLLLIQSFLFLYLVFLLALLSLSLLLSLVLPIILLDGYIPFIGQLRILYFPRLV